MDTATTLNANQIRQQFIEYFKDKQGHTFAPSSPVVPHNDPTLLFANAGMNQFKPYFLGTEKPPYSRAANTQKCIRAGGKHNDLDDVGKDTYHHTFFEMLGNWSFGDYFKEEAIDWAWDLLVNVWGLDPERLHATYFEGDASENLEPDAEAKSLWAKYLPDSRIHPGNKKDNFWEMGDTGPCGPCSEVHYDGTPGKNGGDQVNQDDPLVIEIWNLVFIQFNRQQDSSLVQLPNKHVDTGMGFERIVRVIQDKDSNYDSDVFSPLFSAIEKVTGARPYEGGEDTLENAIDTAYRVIADHIRCLTFALTDGAHCGNKGRDAVLRTILRRAVRFGHQQLGVEDVFFYKLVKPVIKQMGEAFPELAAEGNQQKIEKELKEEEESFRKTLERGIAIFDEAVASLKEGDTLDGETAFDMESTYGFPISLTQVMADERKLSLDIPGYEAAKEKHAAISRGQGEGDGVDVKPLLIEAVQQHELKDTAFTGHHSTEDTSTIQQLFSFEYNKAELTESLSEGVMAAIITESTPFYGEAGGQVGDTGELHTASGHFIVTDTQKVGQVHFHIGHVESGDIINGAQASLKVNSDRRLAVTKNHTTTHVMNRALRDLVNKETQQKGSLVNESRLRFDFSQDQALTEAELTSLEEEVNKDIKADLNVNDQVAEQEAALGINGLRAVFGEKYPPKVRVVSIGADVDELLGEPKSDRWNNLSIEFCGGTHLNTTGQAERFTILSEEGVAKGIRRLTATTGDSAKSVIEAGDALLKKVSDLGSADAEAISGELPELLKTIDTGHLPLLTKLQAKPLIQELQQKVKQLEKEKQKQAAGNVVDTAREIAEAKSGETIIVCEIPGADGGTLRDAMDVIKSKNPDSAMLLGATDNEKCFFLAFVPKPLIGKGLKAGDWVREVAKVAGGGGGGRPDMAQAGGKDPAKLGDALAHGQTFATEKI